MADDHRVLSAALSSHNPSVFSQQPKLDNATSTLNSTTITTTTSTKLTANALQFISNYKLRVESAKNELRLRHLLGHISIYDAVREWRQAEVSASIRMAESNIINKLSHAAESSETKKSLSSHLEPPSNDDEDEDEEEDQTATSKLTTTSANTVKNEPIRVHQQRNSAATCRYSHHHSHPQSFSEFQAALQVQIDSLKQVRAAHAQLIRRSRSHHFNHGNEGVDSDDYDDDDDYEDYDDDYDYSEEDEDAEGRENWQGNKYQNRDMSVFYDDEDDDDDESDSDSESVTESDYDSSSSSSSDDQPWRGDDIDIDKHKEENRRRMQRIIASQQHQHQHQHHTECA